MFVYVLHSILLISLCSASALVDKNVVCENAPRGFFCTADLRGVRECNSPNSNEVTIDTQCNKYQQCGCGVLRMCSEDEPKCVGRVNTPRFPSIFRAVFRGSRNVSSPGGLQKYTIRGFVSENGKTMERVVRTTLFNDKGELHSTVTKTTVKSGDKWITYEETVLADNRKFCTFSTQPSFYGYFEDLKNYSYRFPKDGKRRRTNRVYRRGPLFPNGGFTVKEWKLVNIRWCKVLFPVFESIIDNAGPIGKTNTQTNLRYQLRSVGRRFPIKVPENCSSSK